MKQAETFSEIEIKLAADSISESAFLDWAQALAPIRYKQVSSPDVYLENGAGTVVRHRYATDGTHFNQLTIKKRRSVDSIRDRLEVNLNLDETTSVAEAKTALTLLGYSPALELYKTSHIYWVQTRVPGRNRTCEITVVLYTVWRVRDGVKTDQRRFLEVEVEASNRNLALADRLRVLDEWEGMIRTQFGLDDDALNLSLWEIYSGKTYALV